MEQLESTVKNMQEYIKQVPQTSHTLNVGNEPSNSQSVDSNNVHILSKLGKSKRKSKTNQDGLNLGKRQQYTSPDTLSPPPKRMPLRKNSYEKDTEADGIPRDDAELEIDGENRIYQTFHNVPSTE